MSRLSEQILTYVERQSEGAPISAKSLLHLGNRAAVDQALSRLAERGQLIRAGRGSTFAQSRPGSARERLRSNRQLRRLPPSEVRSSSRMGRLRPTPLA